jgi:hypothetical protein
MRGARRGSVFPTRPSRRCRARPAAPHPGRRSRRVARCLTPDGLREADTRPPAGAERCPVPGWSNVAGPSASQTSGTANASTAARPRTLSLGSSGTVSRAATGATSSPSGGGGSTTPTSARGLGLGRRLLGHLERLAREHGSNAAHLETSDVLPEAIALYRSSGYVEVPAFNHEPFADRWFSKPLLDKKSH